MVGAVELPIQHTDIAGRLVHVIEPNPSGGADWVTTYTYDVLGNLTNVSMPRPSGTQSRSLLQPRRPARHQPRISYQYDGAHHVTKRTDAKGQETRYSYDSYARLTQVQHWANVQVCEYRIGCWYELQEQTRQRVSYSYDANPLNPAFSQNATGRLAAVQFQEPLFGLPYSYQYSYNSAGRVTAQHTSYNSDQLAFDATYSWDDEGRATNLNYAGGWSGTNYKPIQHYVNSFDANGRLSGMTEAVDAGTPTSVAGASYGIAGEILSMSYFGVGESRTYNNLLQLTRIQATGMDMQYLYPAGANNGRISQTIDGILNETATYSYDSVNRLSGVTATGAPTGPWNQTYTYDGFGNLTSKSAVGAYPATSTTYDPATNRPNVGSFDANGNAADGSMVWDIENRMIVGQAGEAYAYDPNGKRIYRRTGNPQQGPTAQEFYFPDVYGRGDGSKFTVK